MIYFLNVINVIIEACQVFYCWWEAEVRLAFLRAPKSTTPLKFTKIPMYTELKYDLRVIIEIRKNMQPDLCIKIPHLYLKKTHKFTSKTTEKM